jgi:hypothetical protein
LGEGAGPERCGVCGARGDCAGGIFNAGGVSQACWRGFAGVFSSRCSERMGAHFFQEAGDCPGVGACDAEGVRVGLEVCRGVPLLALFRGGAVGGAKRRERVPGGNGAGPWALDGAEALATSGRVA